MKNTKWEIPTGGKVLEELRQLCLQMSKDIINHPLATPDLIDEITTLKKNLEEDSGV